MGSSASENRKMVQEFLYLFLMLFLSNISLYPRPLYADIKKIKAPKSKNRH